MSLQQSGYAGHSLSMMIWIDKVYLKKINVLINNHFVNTYHYLSFNLNNSVSKIILNKLVKQPMEPDKYVRN